MFPVPTYSGVGSPGHSVHPRLRASSLAHAPNTRPIRRQSSLPTSHNAVSVEPLENSGAMGGPRPMPLLYVNDNAAYQASYVNPVSTYGGYPGSVYQRASMHDFRNVAASDQPSDSSHTRSLDLPNPNPCGADQEVPTDQGFMGEEFTENVSDDAAGKPMEWAEILQKMEERDHHIVTSWKDDLNNLLVFAGLFSSVVASFAVASMVSLQPTAPDPWLQVQLLAQISTQLSSLTISPGFLNSTTPQNPMLTVPPAASTPVVQTRINTLWFLSLGLSLVASLFAVVVQQWLREYLSPRDEAVDAHQCVRLRQLRHQSLLNWGVPQIVGVLPVLLQVAVIFFLSGLCLLLDDLNTVVARNFEVLIGVSTFAYSAFTILPILFAPLCPYKSQLVDVVYHAIVVVYSIVSFIVLLIALITLYIVCLFELLLELVFTPSIHSLLYATRRFYVLAKQGIVNSTALRLWLFKPALKFGQGRPWRSAEIAYIRRNLNASSLDADALIWARSIIPVDKRISIDLHLRDLPAKVQATCSVSLAAQALGYHAPALARSFRKSFNPLGLPILRGVDLEFARRFEAPLIQALGIPNLFDGKALIDHNQLGPMVLAILRTSIIIQPAAQRNLEHVQNYARSVLAIRKQQSELQILRNAGWVRLSTQCLYECSKTFSYDFNDDEITELLSQAKSIQDSFNRRAKYSFKVFPLLDLFQKLEGVLRIPPAWRRSARQIHGILHRLHMLLLSATTALHALSRRCREQQWHEDWSAQSQSVLVGVDKLARGILDSYHNYPLTDTTTYDGRRKSAWETYLRSHHDSVRTLIDCVKELHGAGLLPDILQSEQGGDYVFTQSIQNNFQTALMLGLRTYRHAE